MNESFYLCVELRYNVMTKSSFFHTWIIAYSIFLGYLVPSVSSFTA